MTVLAIDPGPVQSAYVIWDGSYVQAYDKCPNVDLLLQMQAGIDFFRVGRLVIEQVASYGMPVGAEVFDTVFWAGRFFEAMRGAARHRDLLPRRDVKLHLCGQARAKDANIRQALIDRFGGKDKAIGKKAAPGPLYGLTADEWQALALAVTYWDLHGSPAQTPEE